MSDAYESLCQSLTILHQAASAELTDIEEAMELYLAAVDYLSGIVGSIPAEYGEIVRRNMAETRLRIENLRRVKWMKEQPKFFPEFSTQFARIPIPVENFSVPHSSFSRVFWLMQVFQLSIQKGSFITPHLYVPKEVWYQDGNIQYVRHVGAKQRYFSSLSRAIQPLAALHSLGDSQNILNSLKQFKDVVAQHTKHLEEEMGTQSSLQLKKKSFWASLQSSLVSTEKDIKYEQLLASCSTFFEQCQLLTRFFVYFSAARDNQASTSEILDLLTQIGSRLYAGPCICVLRDMVTLVDRYHHKCRKSVCSLLPIETKIVDEQVGN